MPRHRPHFLPLLLLCLALATPLYTAPAAMVADLTIGVGPDSRQQLVAELTILLLAKEGHTATVRRGMREEELPLLLSRGEIDLCFQSLPPQPAATLADAAILTLPAFAFAAGPVLLMRASQAKELEIETISQLAALSRNHPNRFRFTELDPVAAGQLAPYRLPIAVGHPPPPALLYHALKNRRIDVAIGRGDDGRIVAFRLVALTDDRNLLPELRTTPLLRKEALTRLPALGTAINRLTEQLDGEAMRRLHAGVEIGHREPRAMALEWLQGMKLL